MGANAADGLEQLRRLGHQRNREGDAGQRPYMQEHLLAHGWKYMVIDFRWYDSVSPNDDRDFNQGARRGKTLRG